MFGIGMPELLVIFVIALVVFGPRELPKLAKGLGRVMAEFKRTSDDLMQQINQELEATETGEAQAPSGEAAPASSDLAMDPTAGTEAAAPEGAPPWPPADADAATAAADAERSGEVAGADEPRPAGPVGSAEPESVSPGGQGSAAAAAGQPPPRGAALDGRGQHG